MGKRWIRQKITPPEFTAKADIDSGEYKWDRVKKYENIVFKVSGNCPKLGVLYMCKDPEVPINARVIELARYNDGVPAYTLIDFVPLSPTTTLGWFCESCNSQRRA